jgi:hypothetical protein
MARAMVKPVSPYLQRPLRSLEEVLRELGQAPPGDAGPAASEAAPPQPADKTPATTDSVTIAGVAVPVEPGERPASPTGSQLDVTA